MKRFLKDFFYPNTNIDYRNNNLTSDRNIYFTTYPHQSSTSNKNVTADAGSIQNIAGKL
jgi:hypothetical protein